MARPALRSGLDLVEGFLLAHALRALDRHGILASLVRPAAADILAKRHNIDAGMLNAALELLAARTGIIRRRGGKFVLTREYDSYSRFLVHQYLGAYGPNAVAFDRILRKPALGRRLVDRGRHAQAFAESPAWSSVLIADLAVQLGLNHVLDLGCGSGMLLVDLAGRVAGFRGWGVDSNPAMCAAARKRLKAAQLAGRVRILEGDSRRPRSAIPASVAKDVRTVTASNLVNEFFAGGTELVTRWLAALKAKFPGRVLLIGDYYGRLGQAGAQPQMLLLHDFVQVISGQGIPPPDLASWKKIYRDAQCSLIHVAEDRDATFFVHLLKL